MPDMIVASTTATQKEIDHAVSADWRSGIPQEAEKPAVEAETPVIPEGDVETAPASEPEQQQEEKPQKGQGGFQKKIAKLTKEKSEALEAKEALERELASFKERFEAIEQKLAGPKPAEPKIEAKTAPEAQGKPLESEIGTKYKTWEEYNEALIDWKADQRLEARLKERDESSQAREEREIAEARAEGYKEVVTEFVKEHPDFNEKISAAAKAGMKLPEPIIEKIQELPNGPAVTYYLVTNPDEALAMVELDPVEGFIALGRISQGLEAEVKPKPAAKPPAAKPVSAAPAAVKPVAGHSARSGNTLQDASLRSTDEYVRARMAQLREREARRY